MQTRNRFSNTCLCIRRIIVINSSIFLGSFKDGWKVVCFPNMLDANILPISGRGNFGSSAFKIRPGNKLNISLKNYASWKFLKTEIERGHRLTPLNP